MSVVKMVLEHGGTDLGARRVHAHAELVGGVVVVQHLGAHLAAIVGEEGALAGPQAHARHPAEPGPDQLRVAVLAAAAAAVESHRVARVRRQVDAVAVNVLRKRRRRLHRLDHA